MPQACERTRVIKKFSPNQPGAIKLARRYGSSLVCVRYRESMDGAIRFITIELLVDQVPVIKKKPDAEIVAIQLNGNELELRQHLMASGAQWDPRARVWRIPRGLARRLRLMNRVTAK
jgi:hypothetical protein